MIERVNTDDDLYEHYRVIADPNQEPMRLDKFLMNRLPHVSRNKLQTAIKEGFVVVNRMNVMPNYRVRPDDVILVVLPEPPRETGVISEDIPLDIVYEDDDLLMVNKAAGMVVHPAYQNWTGTLVNALRWRFENLPTLPNNAGKPGLVHRIDKDTSGLLVVAKTEHAMTHLAKQFFDHSIERTYYALVWGEPKQDRGTIDVHLGRSTKDRRITIAYPEGDQGYRAVTHYEVMMRLRYVSLVKCNLETGKTHQIRAHMRHLGHPLFADATYGGMVIRKGTVFTKYRQFVDNCFKVMPRQALHAKSLGFIHPTTGLFMRFNSELPEDFRSVLAKWEHYVDHVD